jgi:NADPH:quinone reductase-like Zn-dependent oxidoreductase
MMNAAVLHTLDEPPHFEQFPEPIAEDNEVIVDVRAAALKPIDKQMANGSHYAAYRKLPVVCGVDGVGCLDDGTRVFFGGPRPPYGSMAERTVVSRSRCFPIPGGVADEIAAAVVNPGLSAWGALAWRAQLSPGETVLILGATGVTGKLAIQTAKLLGAGRVVAAGRNEQVLNTLHDLGADTTIRIDKPGQDLTETFAREAGNTGFDVIIDYLWGAPTEALLAGIARSDFNASSSRVRLVEVGESAAPTISLPAAVLRSSRLEILGAGSGSAPASPEMWVEAVRQLMSNVASGALRIDTERVPLSEVENAWHREQHGRRTIIVP